MRLVLFSHPQFLKSQSMPRFAGMLMRELTQRGHDVEIWTAKPYLHRVFAKGGMAKWAGYIDQYLIFPLKVRWRLRRTQDVALYVFCDQALGPWVPLVSRFPHVVHCHDFLALKSAITHVPENPTSITGKIYQRYIRRGFRHARHFISVSRQTKDDLHQFGIDKCETSVVVYNGLNYPYSRMKNERVGSVLGSAGVQLPSTGFLLHVGGGQWYKNTAGAVRMYATYAGRHENPHELWIVGPAPNAQLQAAVREVPESGRVRFFRGLDNEVLQALYSSAAALIHPSLAEGFGWPITEAAACGCRVVTSDAAPMNEVASPSAVYIPRLKVGDNLQAWREAGADQIEAILGASPDEKDEASKIDIEWARQFAHEIAIEAYLGVYERVASKEPGTIDTARSLGARHG